MSLSQTRAIEMAAYSLSRVIPGLDPGIHTAERLEWRVGHMGRKPRRTSTPMRNDKTPIPSSQRKLGSRSAVHRVGESALDSSFRWNDGFWELSAQHHSPHPGSTRVPVAPSNAMDSVTGCRNSSGNDERDCSGIAAVGCYCGGPSRCWNEPPRRGISAGPTQSDHGQNTVGGRPRLSCSCQSHSLLRGGPARTRRNK